MFVAKSVKLYCKPLLAGPRPCFAHWTQSFLFDKCSCMVYEYHKKRSFRVLHGVPQRSFLGFVFSFFINDLTASLPTSVSRFLYADNLAIWSSLPWFLLLWRLHKELWFDWSAGLRTGVFPSIEANVRSFRWILIMPTSSHIYSTAPLL